MRAVATQEPLARELAVERGPLVRILAVAQVLHLVVHQRQRRGEGFAGVRLRGPAGTTTPWCRTSRCARTPWRRARCACRCWWRRHWRRDRRARARNRRDRRSPSPIHDSWTRRAPSRGRRCRCSRWHRRRCSRVWRPSPRTDTDSPPAGRCAGCRVSAMTASSDAAAAQQAAVHARMQRLDAAVHDFRKAGVGARRRSPAMPASRSGPGLYRRCSEFRLCAQPGRARIRPAPSCRRPTAGPCES